MGDESPALKPPIGVVSHLSSPPTPLYKWNVLCVSVCLTLTSLLFILRSTTRTFLKGRPIWKELEDWTCFLAWVGLIAFCAVITVTVQKHGGVHQWNVTVGQEEGLNYWFNLATVLYGPAILLTKLAVLLLYRRIFFAERGMLFNWGTRLFMAVLTAYYVAITIVKIFECTPREKIWHKNMEGTCINTSALLNSSGLFNTITDFMILLIPIQSVWKLKMSKTRKLVVVLVFTLGLTAPVFSLIGNVVRFEISANPDHTYHQVIIQLWATAEIAAGLICVCIPDLGPLVNLLLQQKPSQKDRGFTRGTSTSQRRYPTTNNRTLVALGDDDLLELSHIKNGTSESYAMHAIGVTTGIQGGLSHSDQEDEGDTVYSKGDGEGHTDDAAASHGILTTVRMEQTQTIV